MFLRAKRPQRGRARRNGCFRRLVPGKLDYQLRQRADSLKSGRNQALPGPNVMKVHNSR